MSAGMRGSSGQAVIPKNPRNLTDPTPDAMTRAKFFAAVGNATILDGID